MALEKPEGRSESRRSINIIIVFMIQLQSAVPKTKPLIASKVKHVIVTS